MEAHHQATQSPSVENLPAKRHRGPNPGVRYDPRREEWIATVGSGEKRERRGFATEAAALNWRRQKVAELEILGEKACMLADAVRRDVVFAQKLLLEAGHDPDEPGLWTLLAREHIDRCPSGNMETFAMAAAALVASVTDMKPKPRTLRDLHECLTQPLRLLGHRLVSDIRSKDVMDVLDRVAPDPGLRRRNVLGKMRRVFKHCQERGILGGASRDNPCLLVKVGKITRSKPEPISVPDARKLLALAIQSEDELGCTAWIAMRMFLGIRNSEAAMVRFGDVDGINLRGRFVRLDDRVAKVRARTVYFGPAECPDPEFWPVIPKNVGVILDGIANLHPKRFAPGAPLFPGRRKADLLTALARKNGISLPSNCLRSGFASYHAAFFKVPKLSAWLMGHSERDGGLRTFYDNYYAPKSYEEGRDYFAIGLNGLAAAAAAFEPTVQLAALKKGKR